jgi:RHS repeat-associated protein
MQLPKNRRVTPSTKTLPNGIVTSYNYDGMNRLKELKHQQGSTVLADNNYSYNPANQISGVAELSDTKTFGYDNVDRLTSMTSPTLTGENYSFDEVGNRTSSHLSSSYNYEANNRLRESETHTKINYDYNGNPTEINRLDGTTLFTWDYENRVVTANNGDEIKFEYDALGRRVKRTKGTETTKFTCDGQDVVMDNVNSVITKYQNGLGIDSKLKLKTGSVSKYFLQDHLGSTTALTNSSGSVVESASYDSFGNSTNNLSTRYGYTGREFDADLGLQYSRARWYDATIGRFISEDPIGLNGGINQYSYVRNNSVNRVDPLGLQDTDIIILNSPPYNSPPYNSPPQHDPHQVYNCDYKCQQDLETMKGTFDKTVENNTANGRRLPTSGELGGWLNNGASSYFAIQGMFNKFFFGTKLFPDVEGCTWQAQDLKKELEKRKYNYNWNFTEGKDFYTEKNVNPDNYPWLPHTWVKVEPQEFNSPRPSFRFDPWKNEWEVLK